MKTLFDTSVILDARDSKSPWHAWAIDQIAEAVAGEGALVNPIVLAEASIRTTNKAAVLSELEAWGLEIVDLPKAAALPAATAFATYRERLKTEGKPGARLPLLDFFIGAHAKAAGLSLATRDAQRVRTYFPDVPLITP